MYTQSMDVSVRKKEDDAALPLTPENPAYQQEFDARLEKTARPVGRV